VEAEQMAARAAGSASGWSPVVHTSIATSGDKSTFPLPPVTPFLLDVAAHILAAFAVAAPHLSLQERTSAFGVGTLLTVTQQSVKDASAHVTYGAAAAAAGLVPLVVRAVSVAACFDEPAYSTYALGVLMRWLKSLGERTPFAANPYVFNVGSHIRGPRMLPGVGGGGQARLPTSAADAAAGANAPDAVFVKLLAVSSGIVLRTHLPALLTLLISYDAGSVHVEGGSGAPGTHLLPALVSAGLFKAIASAASAAVAEDNEVLLARLFMNALVCACSWVVYMPSGGDRLSVDVVLRARRAVVAPWSEQWAAEHIVQPAQRAVDAGLIARDDSFDKTYDQLEPLLAHMAGSAGV
jgi:hypothetical protein